jgi:hypothetical protein
MITLQLDTPTASHPHVRDDRDAPLLMRRDAHRLSLFPKKRKRKIAVKGAHGRDPIERICKISF